MERRSFLDTIGGAVLALGTLGCWSTLLTGCTVTLADVLTEIGNVLTFIAPLISGVLPIVEVADPVLAPAVTGANTVFQAGVTAVSALLDQWSAASAAAQPGIVSQLQAAAQALQSDLSKLLAAHVSDATTASEVAAIVTAATQEITVLLTFIAELKTSGGTTTALTNAAKHYTGSLTPTADARASIVHHLRKPTGNAPLDAVRQRIAKKLSEITVKRTRAGKDTFLDVPV